MAAQYSTTVAVENLLKNREWFSAFELSDNFDELSETEQFHAFAIAHAVTELIYFIQLKTVNEWEPNDLEEVLTYNIPVQIAAQDDFFAAVAPVMKSYLTYLGQSSRIENPQGMIDRLEEVAPTMMTYSHNDNLWSANKILGMQMIYGDIPLKAASDLAEFEQTINCGVPIIKATTPRPAHHFTGNVVELNDELREKYQKKE
ncbi:hypothetical protein C5L31_002154 [Secundilactobacillus malefermentans]|uniref:Uncharacterized protein n=1 Tax=Secundilactobacillus malefermentans TaxID=176292 RepID=A0A4R5NSD6_9LACO|nr:hypothetical protein [Secundilactobacillus malefermentans]KRM59349.1 hypothetical protein FD44_GL001814 [Secundilactobacillus malefermentans DSM 5705 = KCTC 3548]TDG79935.1 hypothetical protein C5L31_002154 [Secundilactobacillus malefermentans]